MRKSVIVTDGLWRKSLSAVRSLGKAEYNVTVCSDSCFTTSFWSSFCIRKELFETAKFNSKEFGIGLIKCLKLRKEKPILLPMEDESLNWCSDNRETLNELCYFLFPPKHSLNIAQNKAQTNKLAKKIGINIPITFFPKCEDELENIISEFGSAGFVVKPVIGSGSRGLKNEESIRETDLHEYIKKYGQVIVQERIPQVGEAVGVSVIFDKESNVKASFVHKRLKEYPITGGPSTDRVSIKNPELEKESIRLLKELNWIGVAMVEWKFDINDNKYKLMEINPRFWGSLELATRSGVDFPTMYAQLASEDQCKEISDYKEGVRCIWCFPGEILRYISTPWGKRENLWQFLANFRFAEEWDSKDIFGFLSALICQPLIIVFDKKYRKFLKR